ncbi:hypothetical protein QEN19_004259 [Hanseniaspora menglaensis]
MNSYPNNPNKRQKQDHQQSEYSNNGSNINFTTTKVPLHLLPLVSDENKNFVIPEPLPNSVSHLKPPSYSVRKYLSNMAILRVYELINMITLSVKQAVKNRKECKSKEEFLKKLEPSILIIDKMFAPYGSVHYAISPNGSNMKIRTFELSVLSFLFFFRGWVENMVSAELDIFVNNMKAQVLNNGTIYVESNDFTIMKSYPDGSRTVKKFNAKVIFDSWLKIEFFELVRLNVETFASENSLSIKNLNSNGELDELMQFLIDRNLDQGMGNKRSLEKMNMGSNEINDPDLPDVYENKQQNGLPFPNYSVGSKHGSQHINATGSDTQNKNAMTNNELLIDFLKKKTGAFNLDSEYGTPANFLKFLQLSDVMTNLKNLMLYQRINNVESPMDSMFRFVNDLRKRERDVMNK